MTLWNHDMSAAPRDGSEVILALPNKTTLRSHWRTPKGEPAHWCMLSHKNEPVAWMPWPAHPNHQSDVGEVAAVKGKARLANAAGVEPLTSSLFLLDDVGSGA